MREILNRIEEIFDSSLQRGEVILDSIKDQITVNIELLQLIDGIINLFKSVLDPIPFN